MFYMQLLLLVLLQSQWIEDDHRTTSNLSFHLDIPLSNSISCYQCTDCPEPFTENYPYVTVINNTNYRAECTVSLSFVSLEILLFSLIENRGESRQRSSTDLERFGLYVSIADDVGRRADLLLWSRSVQFQLECASIVSAASLYFPRHEQRQSMSSSQDWGFSFANCSRSF